MIAHIAASLRNLSTFTTLETLLNPLRALLTPQTLRALTSVGLRPQPDATWSQPPARTLALWPETQALRLTRRPLPAARSKEKSSARPSLRQDHVFARHNKFGSFQVKIEQKTGTRTKTQKTNTTKTKQKNDTKTEQKTMVADNVPTAGQRAVHFRILAIIGVAAACGLSVRLWSSHLAACIIRLHASAPCLVFGP